MNILAIYGGTSSEREVSLRSGKNVHETLERLGHTVAVFDPIEDPAYAHIADHLVGIDVVFPVLHGKGGEDGVLQTVLEAAAVPFVGTGAQASRDCFDKLRTLDMLEAAGLPIPQTVLVAYADLANHPLTKAPFVIKPRDEGSTVDTFLVRDVATFDPAAYADVFAARGSLLLEELIDGVELTVPVLGTQALPVIEIIPPRGQEFDYNNKYNGKTQELCPALHVPYGVQAKARTLAEQTHRVMGCRHLSRTDIMWSAAGELRILEINTLPGMTSQSLYPKSAQVSGLDFDQLIERLVMLAKDDGPQGADQ